MTLGRLEQRTAEKEVESYLRKQIEQAGGRCIKFVPDYAVGFPDRIVLLPGGVLLWVETKRPRGGRLSVVQKVRHAALRNLGQRVEVIWTKQQVDALLAELLGK